MNTLAKFLIFAGLTAGQILAAPAFAEPSPAVPAHSSAAASDGWKPLTAYPDKVKAASGSYQIDGINVGLLQARVTELEKQVERLSHERGSGSAR